MFKDLFAETMRLTATQLCSMWQSIRTGVKWNPGMNLSLEIRGINLKEVKSVAVHFDPFTGDTQSVRQFVPALLGPKVRATNPQCRVRTKVLNDRSAPGFEAELASGTTLVFKTANLSVLDIVTHFKRLANPVETATLQQAKV